MDLFGKEQFSVEKVKNFILQQEEMEKTVEEIRKEVKRLDLREVVALYLGSSYDKDVIDEALKNFEFCCHERPVVAPTPPPVNPGGGNGGEGGADPNKRETVQNWVKRIFGYLLKKKLLTDEEIYRLHDLEYSKKTFGVSLAMFVNTERETIISGHVRYWKTPIEGYYICSQWWKDHDREYTQNIRAWLAKILPDYIARGLDRQ